MKFQTKDFLPSGLLLVAAIAISLIGPAVIAYASTWFRFVPWFVWTCAWTAGLSLLFSFPHLRAWARPGKWSVSGPFLILSVAFVSLKFLPFPPFLSLYAPFNHFEANLLILFYSIIHIFVKTPREADASPKHEKKPISRFFDLRNHPRPNPKKTDGRYSPPRIASSGLIFVAWIAG